MIDYPGGRIGQGDPLVWQVDVVSGEPVSEPTSLPMDLYPAIGIPGGLAVQHESGVSSWDSETGSFTRLASKGFGSPHDVHGDDLIWCRDQCTQLVVTDTSNMEEKKFVTPTDYDMFLTSKVSPDGRMLAAPVGRQGETMEARRSGSSTATAKTHSLYQTPRPTPSTLPGLPTVTSSSLPLTRTAKPAPQCGGTRSAIRSSAQSSSPSAERSAS